jgi:hypothetical protein
VPLIERRRRGPRPWLLPPRLRRADDAASEERHASWLELFFDHLVCLTIAQHLVDRGLDTRVTRVLGAGALLVLAFGRHRADAGDVRRALGADAHRPRDLRDRPGRCLGARREGAVE